MSTGTSPVDEKRVAKKGWEESAELAGEYMEAVRLVRGNQIH